MFELLAYRLNPSALCSQTSFLSVQEADEQGSADADTSGRRPKRRAAVSASKSLRATRGSPDGGLSDDEYKGGSDEEADAAVSDDDAMGSLDEEEDEEDGDL